MEILALVRDVVIHSSNPEKAFAQVTLEVEQPLEILQIRMFKNQVEDGTADRLHKLKGQLVHFPLEVTIYNGRLQLQLAFGGVVRPMTTNVTQPKAVNS